MTNNIKDQMTTNWRKIKLGWTLWAIDMGANVDRLKQRGRPIHFIHACVTTTIREPYRTWGILFYPVAAYIIWRLV